VGYGSSVGLQVGMGSGVASEQEELTPVQLKQLKKVVEGEYP